MQKTLEAVATINLWETNFWEQRRDILFSVLQQNKLDANSKVILAFQEVRRRPFYPLYEIAEQLGFERDCVYFFPTDIGGVAGLGVITNLPVKKKHFAFFTHDINDPLEFGERGGVLMELEDDKGSIILEVTHLSVSHRMQTVHAVESLKEVKNFIIAEKNLPRDEKLELAKKPIPQINKNLRVLLVGDFNADPLIPLYSLFEEAGLQDYTKPLQKKHTYSWPADVEWFINLHKKTFGKQPPYDVKNLQRWIDYIWGYGFTPQKQVLLGTTQENNFYPSDHLIPVVYF